MVVKTSKISGLIEGSMELIPPFGLGLIVVLMSGFLLALFLTKLRIKRYKEFSRILLAPPFVSLNVSGDSPWFSGKLEGNQYFIHKELIRVHHAENSPASKDVAYALYVPMKIKTTPESLLNSYASSQSWIYKLDIVMNSILNRLVGQFKSFTKSNIIVGAGSLAIYKPKVLPTEVIKTLTFSPNVVLKCSISSRDFSLNSIEKKLGYLLNPYSHL